MSAEFAACNRYDSSTSLPEERYQSTNQFDRYSNYESSCPPYSSLKNLSPPERHSPNKAPFPPSTSANNLNISPSAPSAFASNDGEEEPPPTYYEAINY